MKRLDPILIGLVVALLSVVALAVNLFRQIEDLEHQVIRLEYRIQSHEDILVPKHLQGK